MAESKNTFHSKGLLAEAFVYLYFIKQGFNLESYRQKIESTEIDLCFSKVIKNIKTIYLLEIKSVQSFEVLDQRISEKQIYKIKKVLLKLRLANKLNTKIKAFVLYVNLQKNSFVFHDFDHL